MIRKWCSLAVSAAALTLPLAAQAADYRMEFVAKDFRVYDGTSWSQADVAPIHGYIDYRTFFPYNDWIEELLAISLTIDGHAYGLDDLMNERWSQGERFAGRLNDDGVMAGTDDFWLYPKEGGGKFAFTSSRSLTGFYDASDVTIVYRPLAEVPEPGAAAMLLAGLASMGWLRRRGKNVRRASRAA